MNATSETQGGGAALIAPDADPANHHADIVRSFLEAVGKRDLPAASRYLADGFEMIFPGGHRMSRLEELGAFASKRYRFVTKSFDRFDVAGDVVYCVGTLSGEWLDGEPFSGIRFIDRFELADGRIRVQQVWNDIAEVRSR
jgi:hypothetical protein